MLNYFNLLLLHNSLLLEVEYTAMFQLYFSFNEYCFIAILALDCSVRFVFVNTLSSTTSIQNFVARWCASVYGSLLLFVLGVPDHYSNFSYPI